jgi:hypothetical protein
MGTTSIILWSVGTFAAICLSLAMIVGARVASRRGLMNASLRAAHQQHGAEFGAIGRWQWIWMMTRTLPLLLFLSVVSVGYLIVGGIWCLVVRRPKTASTSDESDDHNAP